MIGDHEPSRVTRRRQLEATQILADILGEPRHAQRLGGVGFIGAQQIAIVLDYGAAARGRDQDGVEALALDLGGPGVDLAAESASGSRPIWWAREPQQPSSATTTSMPWRVRRRMAAALIAGAITGLTQPVNSATRPRRGADGGNRRRPDPANFGGSRTGANRSMAATGLSPSAANKPANGLPIRAAASARRRRRLFGSTRARRERSRRSTGGRA